MITSLLIANRGEIARRIIRTARRLGVRTVAVYSEADANAPHVAEADEAVLIGPAPARESYLAAEKILAAAKQTGAEAIHPGYGFLSENAAFAQAVIDAGLVWVGPPPAAINAMGLKDAAKSLMIAAGVPCTPGYLGDDQSEARLEKEAAAIGYPVLIKAVAGGGGKGMRKVERAEDFAAALGAAQREAKAAFGDDRVLVEKYVTRPRHIEVQVFGDTHGNVVHLFERDCSLQRRHQKVIEEAPAPGMDVATRAAVCEAAVKAAKAVNYVGAGTVEFIADASEGLRADRIWFMEMNTRLQVEHPVTEAITGQDLVEWQLRVASGEPLPLKQGELSIDGWAMEARLYAENPATGFLPSTGPLTHFRLPETVRASRRDASASLLSMTPILKSTPLRHPEEPRSGVSKDATCVRIDSAVEEGGEVSTFYDPMIAKLIVHADTRTEAASQLAEACRTVEVWPVKTNAAFLARCLSEPDFVAADIDTGFIERRLEGLTMNGLAALATKAALGAAILNSSHQDLAKRWHSKGVDPWGTTGGAFGFRLNSSPRGQIGLRGPEGLVHANYAPGTEALLGSIFYLNVDGNATRISGSYHPDDIDVDGQLVSVAVKDHGIIVFAGGEALEFSFRGGEGSAGASAASDGAILSPMPGKIVAVAVEAGAKVAKGAPLVTLEAMKMEHALAAPFDGVVAELKVKAGDQVSEGALLVRLEKA
ncbi:MAG: ATP-binding protein [Caulobacteraceae bacterium]